MRTEGLRTVEQYQALFNGLRVTDIAEMLAVSTDQVRALIHARKLKAVNVGTGKRGEYRVHVDEFKRFLEANAS